MEFGSMKLKITLLVIATDKTKNIGDLSSLKFLFNEDSEPISVSIDILSEDTHSLLLKDLFEKYINYDYGYVYKLLVAARSGDNLLELCYIVNMPYIKGFNKRGNLFTLEDFEKETIVLEEFYERLYSANGSRSFR